MQADIAIVGGGPAGLSTAHAAVIARPGLRVAVLERADMRPRGAVVSLAPNGVRAAEAIDPRLRQTLAAADIGFLKHRRFSPGGELRSSSDQGELTTRVREHGQMFTLPWHSIQTGLAEALPPGVLHTHHRFMRYTETGDGVVAEFDTPHGVVAVEARLLVGCDGGQSLVREQLLGDGPPEFLGMAIWRARCPRPASWPLDEGWAIWGEPGRPTLLTCTLPGGNMSWQAVVPWPRDQLEAIGGGRRAYVQEIGPEGLGVGQLGQGSSGGNSGKNGRGGDGSAARHRGASGRGRGGWRWSEEERVRVGRERLGRVLAAFEGFPPEVLAMLTSTDPTGITEHGQFCRDVAQCQTYAKGRVALVGDAAHLATPFLGQGTSQAIEDALELGRALGLHGPTPEALAAYQQVRLPQASAVQEASVEMCREYSSGRLSKNEHEVSIERGFVMRTFQPL